VEHSNYSLHNETTQYTFYEAFQRKNKIVVAKLPETLNQNLYDETRMQRRLNFEGIEVIAIAAVRHIYEIYIIKLCGVKLV